MLVRAKKKKVNRGFNARIDVWPVTFCIFSHNRFVRILAIIPAGYIISVVNCLVSAYLCNKIGWPTPKGSWKLHNPPLAQGSKPHDPPPLCFFLGNLPRGGGGVSGAFGVVLGCESGGIAADESGLWNLLYIDNVWLFFFFKFHDMKESKIESTYFCQLSPPPQVSVLIPSIAMSERQLLPTTPSNTTCQIKVKRINIKPKHQCYVDT